MHEAIAIIAAPFSIIILALETDFLPGQPQQLTNPIISVDTFFNK